MTYFYISFATDELGFLGATVVEATGAGNALAVATMRGLNPGGEAAILAIPTEAEDEPDVQAGITRMLNRLLSREEIRAHGATRYGDLPEEIQDAFDDAADYVCPEHNPVKPG